MIKNKNRQFYRGDIFYISSLYDNIKDRPAVIVSNNHANRNGGNVSVVYLTQREQSKEYPMHVPLADGSTVCCETVTTVDKKRVNNYKCTLTKADMKEVDMALMVHLGLDFESST